MISRLIALLVLLVASVPSTAFAQKYISGGGSGTVQSGYIAFDNFNGGGGSKGGDITGNQMEGTFLFQYTGNTISYVQFFMLVHDVPDIGDYAFGISLFLDEFSWGSAGFTGNSTSGHGEMNLPDIPADSNYNWGMDYLFNGPGKYITNGYTSAYLNQASPFGGDVFINFGWTYSGPYVFFDVPESSVWIMLIFGFGFVGAFVRRARTLSERRAIPS